MSKSVPVVISYNGERRQVGIVKGDTLFCPRDTNKHLFRYRRATIKEARAEGVSAWGLDCKVCDGLLAKGVKTLEICTGSASYTCSLADTKEHGEVLNMKPHRAQYFLNEKYFTRRYGIT